MAQKDYEVDDQPSLGDLISLSKAAKQSGLSPGYLRILVRNGEMWGKKIGRNWVTTGKAVKDYLARDLRPGRPKTKQPDPHKGD
jgi:hypothetical protein